MRRQTHGTLLKVGNDAASNEVFTTVAHNVRVKPPGETRGVTEIADHDMTGFKQKLADKLASLTAVTLHIYLDPANATHQTVREYADGLPHNWQILIPGLAEPYEFSAFVTNYEPGDAGANDGILEGDITLDPDGVTYIVPEA